MGGGRMADDEGQWRTERSFYSFLVTPDFNRVMKDLLMKDHFVKGFYTLGKKSTINSN